MPEAEMPAVMIVTDPGRGYWLRVIESHNHVRAIGLGDERTLPGAVQRAESLGYSPTHWSDEFFIVSTIPTGMVSRLSRKPRSGSTRMQSRKPYAPERSDKPRSGEPR